MQYFIEFKDESEALIERSISVSLSKWIRGNLQKLLKGIIELLNCALINAFTVWSKPNIDLSILVDSGSSYV